MQWLEPTQSVVYPFQQAIASISLAADRRTIFEERYLKLLESSHRRCRQISKTFHGNRAVVTVGSIIVPALLSIQYSTNPSVTGAMYWVTWVVSLFVTISNGLLTMFKLDKKYYVLHTSYEQLKTEGWQYLALTGNYKSGSHGPPTHEGQFAFFCQTIERIRMKQMEEEYIKIQDVNGTQPSQPRRNSGGIPSLVDVGKTPLKDDLVLEIAKVVKEQVLAITKKTEPIVGDEDAKGAET